ncbi:MAG: polyribonucleotide nucleotidyltransferase [Bacteroidales bacterium]|nr:polyribonucleotide nucleotidyltransferase [Bacteroidales bacterium]MDD4830197.1 polyribonucleotide nucleotidyltransferase [Bacteroidales bacterium]
MQGIKKVFTIEDGRQIEIETGKLAKQADGSVVVKMGNTMLLATVCSKKQAAENVDFMPLTVDYQEKYASVGRFPGGFFKREARPSEYEILIARLVDRALRPLFPDDFHAEVQVQITLISGDQSTPPDALAALAASAALAVSDIPFHGPVSEVRVAYIDGKFILSPSIEELEKAELDLIVAATEENIMMVEGEMKEVSEDIMLEALKIAHESIKLHCRAIKELEIMVNKTQKREYCHETNDLELKNAIHQATYQKCYDFAKQGIACKSQRSEGFQTIKQEFIDTLSEEEAKEKSFLIDRYYHAIEKEAMRDMVLNERVRLDGRKLDQIRPIWAEVDYLPTTHGSAIFTRGETQSLTTCTLGTKLDEQIIDGAIIEGKNNFILHYNFPGFATGEVKGNRGTSRREIGHGNLAMRALKQVLPSSEECPYTIRIVSDILESNGSSSMATVCAGCLALMDAGVQIRKPVSGIAMGLIAKDGKWAVLSDILGDEDHLGDMDFKVTGTRDGITACQMDIKCDGLSYEILAKALAQAQEGRMHILNIIEQTMPSPREDYKPFVPRVVKMSIPKEFIGAIIGPGGKIIQEMQKETKTIIVIEEKGEFGVIDIVSVNKEGIEAALARIKGIIAVPEVGEEYEGVVKNLQSFGAFVEFLPGKDGLLHVSEISWERVNNVEEVLKSGDKIKVKLIEVDKKTGKYKLSHKALLPKPEGYVERAPRQNSERSYSDRPQSERPQLDRPKPQKPPRPLDDNFYIE